MINLITPINNILKLNTRLFINVLNGIDEKIAQKRANKYTNNARDHHNPSYDQTKTNIIFKSTVQNPTTYM